LFYLNPLQIDRIHNGSLEELHGGKMTFEQTLKFQIGWFTL